MKFCIWITGLPGSGKSTISEKLETSLRQLDVGIRVLHLDEIRKFVTPVPTYKDEERDIVYSSLAFMAHLLVETDCKNVVVDATGNRKKYRDNARELIPEFAEIYVKCPPEICMEREAARDAEDKESDLYAKAGSGKLKGKLPGVTAVYEEPEKPELIIPSDELTPAESAEKIIEYIRARWFNL